MKGFVGALLCGAMMAAAAPAAVTVSYEAPGVQQTTQAIGQRQVATFDTMSGWVGSGTIFAGTVSGAITQGGFLVGDANSYGGAGGTGKFATVYNTTTIQLSRAVTYAGLWASAIDGDFATSLGNTVALYSGNTLLGSYALKPQLAGASDAYWGNPNAAFAGQDASEPFAFLNFRSTTGFDRIDLVQNGGGGFELDNVTIGGAPLSLRGVASQSAAQGAVPEPASWAMMLGGFGLTGAMLRGTRRRRVFL